MQTHTRTLFQRAFWALLLLLHVGAAAGISTQHDDARQRSNLSTAPVAESGQESEPGDERRAPAPDFDFDCVLCVAAHLQVLPTVAVDLEGLFFVRTAFLHPESDRAVDGTPVLARHPRGPPLA